MEPALNKYAEERGCLLGISLLPDELLPAIKATLDATNLHSSLDTNRKVITTPQVINCLKSLPEISKYLTLETTVSLDQFLYLYIHINLSRKLRACDNYLSIVKEIRKDPLFVNTPFIQQQMNHCGLAYKMVLEKVNWPAFTAGFTAESWYEIHLLEKILPLSDATIAEGIDWLTLIVEKQSRDGAIGMVAQQVYDWVKLFDGTKAAELDSALESIAKNAAVNQFFTPFLKGLNEIQSKNSSYYRSQLGSIVEPDNAYYVLYALGVISIEDTESREQYFVLILAKLDQNILALHEFIQLCGYLKLYRTELYEKIDAVIQTTEDVKVLGAIIDLLHGDMEDAIDREWFKKIVHFVFAKHAKEMTSPLDYFLLSLLDKDLALAYDLLEFRFRVMAHINFLEHALIEMVRKDVSLFRSKIIKWLSADDDYLHVAVRKVTSTHHIDKSVFEIPADLFENVTMTDKVFMAHKVIGHVYSMEELQRLLLSIIKSIDSANEAVQTDLEFLLSEYVVYNYRSTLELMRKSLKEETLSSFAKSMFEKVVSAYEKWFEQLRSITIDKELRIYNDFKLLRGYYQRQQMKEIAKAPQKSSFAALFKNTQLNSNRWSVREDNDGKHQVQDLNTISLSMEYPSGENLCPVFMEHIRKEYQNLKKHEINID